MYHLIWKANYHDTRESAHARARRFFRVSAKMDGGTKMEGSSERFGPPPLYSVQMTGRRG